MSDAKMYGLIIGAVIGIAICVIIFRFINRDKKMFTEYDEMQKKVRGEGYKYAFYAVIIAEALLSVVTSRSAIPVEPFVLHFMLILFGVLVHVSYCIWNDAYVGLNTNLPRFVVIMTVISLFNFFIAFMAYREGRMFENGILMAPAINLLCGLMLAFIGVMALLKKLVGSERD